ncbi:hypothetical protein AB835_09430 [Candidatus Endobugula sertula]|uniref:MPN domain-containing protein n=1 Tax=Candidatus Endobugula sertula TaxID=62101 RepID=A0A1D2QP77_9GAMM|nr:hypothetical protein AB835_09430 [Candidatus Endobugula sertula]
MHQIPLDFREDERFDRFSHLAPQSVAEHERPTIISLALELVKRDIAQYSAFTSPAIVRDFLRLNMADYKREVFGVLFLNHQHELLAYEELFQGTIGSCSVYPREVVRRSLESSSDLPKSKRGYC